MTRTRKFLIALTAPVGSGKSYVARMLAQKLGALHVRTDDIRVWLRAQGKSYSSAPMRARKKIAEGLAQGRWVIADFDAFSPERQRQLSAIAKKFGAHFFLIRIRTPKRIILARLRKHRYTPQDLFSNAKEAIRVYHIRRKVHEKGLKGRADFVIYNARLLKPQIARVVKKIKGL